MCKNTYSVKIHVRGCYHRPDPQVFTGTCADVTVRDLKMVATKKYKTKVKCDPTDM